MLKIILHGGPYAGLSRAVNQDVETLTEYAVKVCQLPAGNITREVYRPRRDGGSFVANADGQIVFDYVGAEL